MRAPPRWRWWVCGLKARAPLFFPTPAAEGTEGVQVLGARTMDGRGPIGSARGGAGRPGGSGPKLAVEKGAEESERAKKKKKNATTAAGRCAARQGRGGAFCVQGALRRPPSFTQGHPQMPARRHPHPGRPGERQNGRAGVPPGGSLPSKQRTTRPARDGPPRPSLSAPLSKTRTAETSTVGAPLPPSPLMTSVSPCEEAAGAAGAAAAAAATEAGRRRAPTAGVARRRAATAGRAARTAR